MAAVSIGIPVYNGATTLRDALECLRTQTFTDIEVIVSDNCSTDGSAEIAEAFARADPRFRLVRQAENIGARNNFRALIDLAMSDLFMWRADDDLSNETYVDVLKRRLDENPAASLAVAKTVFLNANGDVTHTYTFDAPAANWRPLRTGQTLVRASPTWIYGLWKRDALRGAMDRTGTDYPYLWAWDPMTLFPVLLDNGVVVDHEAVLIMRSMAAPRYSWRVPAREMSAMRRAFRKSCFIEFNRRKWSPLERIVLTVYVLRFANRRVYRFLKMVRVWIREKLGIVKQ